MDAGNPFEFGRELSSEELVDREEELDVVLSAMRTRGRLFVIGPRRFGKTSILRSATERASKEGIVVLRHDAEAYPTLHALAEAVISDAARQLTSSVERAGKKLRELFETLRPAINYNPMTNTLSVTLVTDKSASLPHLLTTVLDGLERMASEAEGPVAVVIDEFQHVVEHEGAESGLATERQLRAAVQRHQHIGYVFAGSKTTLLTEMTGQASRPFYRLGERLFVGSIPRADFESFLRRGFEDAGTHVHDGALTTLLDLAQDVPYNVQRLAHACWNDVALQHDADAVLTSDRVADALERLVRRDDPFYTQIWVQLTSSQQKALLALVANDGSGLFGRAVLSRYDLPAGTMRTALESLVRTGVALQDESGGTIRYRLADPFFATWLALFTVQP